jgi:hypothetical protein
MAGIPLRTNGYRRQRRRHGYAKWPARQEREFDARARRAFEAIGNALADDETIPLEDE